MTPRTYTVQVANEIAERYTEWTRVDSLAVGWFKLRLHEDGTAECVLATGDEEPSA